MSPPPLALRQQEVEKRRVPVNRPHSAAPITVQRQDPTDDAKRKQEATQLEALIPSLRTISTGATTAHAAVLASEESATGAIDEMQTSLDAAVKHYKVAFEEHEAKLVSISTKTPEQELAEKIIGAVLGIAGVFFFPEAAVMYAAVNTYVGSLGPLAELGVVVAKHEAGEAAKQGQPAAPAAPAVPSGADVEISFLTTLLEASKQAGALSDHTAALNQLSTAPLKLIIDIQKYAKGTNKFNFKKTNELYGELKSREGEAPAITTRVQKAEESFSKQRDKIVKNAANAGLPDYRRKIWKTWMVGLEDHMLEFYLFNNARGMRDYLIEIGVFTENGVWDYWDVRKDIYAQRAEASAEVKLGHLVGQSGPAATVIDPNGYASIGGQTVLASTAFHLIEIGAPVTAVGTYGEVGEWVDKLRPPPSFEGVVVAPAGPAEAAEVAEKEEAEAAEQEARDAAPEGEPFPEGEEYDFLRWEPSDE